jgi:hypothetical protein
LTAAVTAENAGAAAVAAATIIIAAASAAVHSRVGRMSTNERVQHSTRECIWGGVLPVPSPESVFGG